MSELSVGSPTVAAMRLRRQHSDYHIFEETELHHHCDRCGRRRGHPDHVTRDDDKAEVMRWRDRAEAAL